MQSPIKPSDDFVGTPSNSLLCELFPIVSHLLQVLPWNPRLAMVRSYTPSVLRILSFLPPDTEFP